MPTDWANSTWPDRARKVTTTVRVQMATGRATASHRGSWWSPDRPPDWSVAGRWPVGAGRECLWPWPGVGWSVSVGRLVGRAVGGLVTGASMTQKTRTTQQT